MFLIKTVLPEGITLFPGTRGPGALETHLPATQNRHPWLLIVMSSKMTTHYLRLVYFYTVNLLQSLG